MFLFQGFKNKYKLRYFLFFSVSFVLATFIRPVNLYITYFLGVLSIIYYLFFALRNKLFLFSIIGFISLNILPIELWKIRNYNISGNKQFVGMETVHIYNYLAPRALAMNSNLNDDEAKKLIDERLLNYKKKNIFNDDEINKYKAKVGKDVLIENIPGFLKHYFLQFPRLFLSFPIEVPSIIYSKNDNKKIYNILKNLEFISKISYTYWTYFL